MNLLKVIFLCIDLFISVHSTNTFPDVPPEYVTKECRERATTFEIPKGASLPLSYDSAQFCMYQNLLVLEKMKSLHLALTTPHFGRSICRIEVQRFDKKAKKVDMKIYDTDLRGNCTPRASMVTVNAIEDARTKEISTLDIPRLIGPEKPYVLKEDARLLFTDYEECLILISPFNAGKCKYCELFVASNDAINMPHTQCHSIYRIYCGYGRPTRDVWPNPAGSSSSRRFAVESSRLGLLVSTPPLKEDTIFMNEFQMIPEVLYHIPEANMYASTYEKTEPRLCGIQTQTVLRNQADLELKMITSGRNQSIETENYMRFHSDINAISPTQISLQDRYGLRRVLVSNFKDCYVFKKVNSTKNGTPSCEFFLKNNTTPTTDLQECWFVFLAYCGYPKALYKDTSCYS
ncbi:uncharacterized protein LOC115308433 [Ixodes scapularis]|uniref:uncharacterized protein LOC115308433 n=1 Tax=Ixodes scapularis TaxID=6945 RepID=UPI001A9CF797|nr:uncharacterized protein LOC115308433 [Ixodes scapularis]